MELSTDEKLELLRVKNQLLQVFKYYFTNYTQEEKCCLIDLLEILKVKYNTDGDTFTTLVNIQRITSNVQHDKSLDHRLYNIYINLVNYRNLDMLKELLYFIQPFFHILTDNSNLVV